MSTMTSATPARTTRMRIEPFNILVATAGDEESTGAVRAAALLARRMESNVEVLTVVTPFPHALPTGLMMTTAAEVDEDGRKAAMARVREQLHDIRGAAAWPVHAAIGWPADCIVAAAQRWGASLIVMGIGEHSPIARLFGSETAIAVAKRSGTPILAVPPTFSRAPGRAFAAIDFSSSSVAGAQLAARLMPASGSVTLVHTSIFAKATTEPGSVMDLYSTGAHDRLERIAKQITRATKRRVKTMLTDGPVAEVLTSVAESAKGDLIALGSHERGLIDRLLIGSVRSEILRRSGCPVLIVPEHGEASE